MSSTDKDDTSNASGGETSADYMISESGKQTEATKGKKRVLDSVTDKIKEKVAGAGKSIKEGAATTVGIDDADDKTKDLNSAQTRQGKIGDAASDPKTTGPTENLREKAAKTIDE